MDGVLIKDMFIVLNIINPIDINNGKFQLSLKTKTLFSLIESINEINKSSAAIGKAEDKKNTPNRNK